jgi:hypothetical protein
LPASQNLPEVLRVSLRTADARLAHSPPAGIFRAAFLVARVQKYCGPPERVMNARAAMMNGCVFAVLPSLPGLTRQSIILRTNLAKMDGCAGQARA